jgi:hypothetical protein
MTISTATLGGTTLPDVTTDGFKEGYGYRGSDREMLSGAVVTDLVTASAKRTFELSWREITETQVNTIKTAFATVDDGSATLVTPLNATVTVTRDVGFMALDIQWRSRGRKVRADVTMKLREV